MLGNRSGEDTCLFYYPFTISLASIRTGLGRAHSAGMGYKDFANMAHFAVVRILLWFY